ncbi:ImmA/IrrE family metallo-endopeptidase [[Clostridium] symbiosum]|uniref:ImmA/IrrE family metallo-endopeptidase n=1 Tax=Clostridium symbiosum TaxID=1512 RepID=UPI00189DCE12|nr:ImmA/IrrE family metallo-endopeptidase [[Clostridium] symbiosum]
MEQYKNNLEINEKVLEIYRQCRITSFPIDCISVLTHYGLKIYTYSFLKEHNPRLYELSYKYSTDAFTYGNIIAYNDNKTKCRIRFSLMHELGHIILNTSSEDAADCFASNILAPRSLMYNLHCENAEEVHTTFEISYAAANRAWYDYRHGYRTDAERAIKELIFPPEPAQEKVKAPETKTEIKKDRLWQDPAYTPSKEFVERREKVLSRIRRQRCKIQKQLKEYEEDMEFIGGSTPDTAFVRAEHQWLYGNDL